MIILVGYATVEGQTRKIAEAVAATVEEAGHTALLFDIASGGEYAIGIRRCHPLCAGACGALSCSLPRIVRQEARGLNSVPSAFVSVSMLIRSEFEEERRRRRSFRTPAPESGWTPGTIHHAAGALRYTEYDFFKRWIIRRMAEHENAPTDVTRDHEFTDWTALSGFVRGLPRLDQGLTQRARRLERQRLSRSRRRHSC